MSDNEEVRMTHVQLSVDLRETLTILKKRFKLRSQNDALRYILQQYYEEDLKRARQILEIRGENSSDDE